MAGRGRRARPLRRHARLGVRGRDEGQCVRPGCRQFSAPWGRRGHGHLGRLSRGRGRRDRAGEGPCADFRPTRRRGPGRPDGPARSSCARSMVAPKVAEMPTLAGEHPASVGVQARGGTRFAGRPSRADPDARPREEQTDGRIQGPAGAGRPLPLEDSQELPGRHARGWADLRGREPDRPDQEGSGAGAGGQRGDLARHPGREPGDARHPLGIRLRHRRRRGDRPGRGGRHLARRRRLRHQLRRAAPAVGPRLGGREAPDQGPGGPALPRHPHGRRPERELQVRPPEARQADGAGLEVRRGPRIRRRSRPRLHRGRRPARRRGARPRQRARVCSRL